MTEDPKNDYAAAFENWAKAQNLNLTMHPLHYLFLDKKTDLARHAWKAALAIAKTEIDARHEKIEKLTAQIHNQAATIRKQSRLIDVFTARYLQPWETLESIQICDSDDDTTADTHLAQKNQCKAYLDKLEDDERLEFILQYCTQCGCKNPLCQCWNDK